MIKSPATFSKTVHTGQALDHKTKEPIAQAIGTTAGCVAKFSLLLSYVSVSAHN